MQHACTVQHVARCVGSVFATQPLPSRRLQLTLGSRSADGHAMPDFSYHSDLFSFIGTIFLWIYWPSFNGVTAIPEFQERAIVNTILGLLSSCIVAFYISQRVRGGHFDAVDIQNATLAGGVAMGTSAMNPIHPFGALLLGGVAGAVSTLGFKFLLLRLEEKGIHDTCGIHNLHGMPGLIGGVAGIVVAAIADADTRNALQYPHGDSQYLYQMAGLGLTWVFALITGRPLRWLAPSEYPIRSIRRRFQHACACAQVRLRASASIGSWPRRRTTTQMRRRGRSPHATSPSRLTT